tara:strand:- start:410 stop:613 length:204 start_codon:yes stop_codon:yes gene_type:complete
MGKAFVNDQANQELVGIKSISRGVSEIGPSTVRPILEAELRGLVKYMEENLDIEASVHILSSKEFSN